MSHQVFFVSLISRENKPIHIQEIEATKSYSQILSDRIDENSDTTNESQSNVDQSKEDKSQSTVSDILKYHFLSNMALDIFLSPFYDDDDDHGSPQLLFIQGGINVYGLETNTGLKILIGTPNKIDDTYTPLFRNLHKIYLSLVINPFQTDDISDLKINKQRLNDKIEKLVGTWKKSLHNSQQV